MKKVLLGLLLVFTTSFASAQGRTVEPICKTINGPTNYGALQLAECNGEYYLKFRDAHYVYAAVYEVVELGSRENVEYLLSVIENYRYGDHELSNGLRFKATKVVGGKSSVIYFYKVGAQAQAWSIRAWKKVLTIKN